MNTLFDKYGGTETMRSLVREFYKHARASPKVGHFFSKLNMEKLIDHQVQFLSFVLGKPALIYKGRELADAHHPLDISNEDFNEIGRLLVNTLSAAGVTDEDVSLIMGVVLEVRDEIVNQPKQLQQPLSLAPIVNQAQQPLSSASATNPIQQPPSPSVASASAPVTNPTSEKVSTSSTTKTEIIQKQKQFFKPVFGGLPKIKMIVRDLYSQVNSEADLRHYFLNVTPEKIISDQEHFSSYVLRKPDHAYLGGFFQSSDLSIQVGAVIFNAVIDVLREILINAGLPEHDTPRLITHIMEIVEETRTQCNGNQIAVLKSVDVSAEALAKVYQKGKLDTIIKGPDLVYASSALKGGPYPFPFFTQIDTENQVITLIAKAEARESVTSEEMGYLLNEAKQYAAILNFYADADDTTPFYAASYSLPFEFGVPNRMLVRIAQQFSKTFYQTFTYDTEEILLKVTM
jgi:hemoglobin